MVAQFILGLIALFFAFWLIMVIIGLIIELVNFIIELITDLVNFIMGIPGWIYDTIAENWVIIILFIGSIFFLVWLSK